MILRGATCLTLDPHRRVLRADLRIDPQGRIGELLPPGTPASPGEEELSLPGRIIMPGLIQTHLHLCQTVMRGLAERRRLGSWLRERIWPLEAAHDEATVRASARLGLLELLTGGTTAILDMGTTRYLSVILDACAQAGIRAVSGTALMNEGDGLPGSLRRPAEEAIDETRDLLRRFPPGAAQRVGLCLAPRFIPSVSQKAWRMLVAFSEETGLLIHTHACETQGELDETRAKTGTTPFAYLERIGAAGRRLVAAHGIWLEEQDREVVRRSGVAIVHCPGSNAKLGSGTADVVALWADGVPVGLGADGAACNNRLDGFEELRRAAHAIAALHGPAAADPAEILMMATGVGARILGLEGTIGSLEPGKAADLIVLNPALGSALWAAGDDLHAQVLYGAGREQIEQVWVGGEKLVHEGRLRDFPPDAVLEEAGAAAQTMKERLQTR